MSEYQYYEFLAIDHPLDEQQQAEVRALAPSARVSATSFTSEYRDGDFRGEEDTELEPPVPAGLHSLTEPQRALAGFLRLDDDLLAVAAQASPPADRQPLRSVAQLLDTAAEIRQQR
jgi:hypothetical protein